MGLFKAIGRAIGRGIEGVGKILHSEKIENAGKKLQERCRETSKRTGQSNSFDAETASEYEAQAMAEILSGFSQNLKKDAEDLENQAKTAIGDYFDVLINALKEGLGECETTRNLRTNKTIILQAIPGKLTSVLSRRVSLSDAECCSILKMPQGVEKENAMYAFGRKVISEGLNSLSKSVEGALNAVSDSVSEGLTYFAEDKRKGLESVQNQLKSLISHLEQDSGNQEAAMLEPAKKLSASEYVLEVLKQL